MKHSNVVGSSTASRRLACPGSVDLEQAAPEPPESSYAAEGTALHEAMEWLLLHDLPAIETHGMSFYGQAISDAHVDLLEFCLRAFDSVVGTHLFETERTMAFPHLDGAFGTGDVIWYDDMYTKAGVVDWKFGAGVPVGVEDNSQLKFLLCALRAADPNIDSTTQLYATIVQPRRDYCETVDVDHRDLDAFEVDLSHALNRRRYEENNLHIGGHCQFCRAMTTCPAQRSRFDRMRTLQTVGNDLSVILDNAKNLQALIKAAEDQARQVLEAGGDVPGYKLVESTGNRAWIDERTTDRWLGKLGVPAAERRQPFRLKSPAQMDKSLPDLKERLATRWAKPATGRAVVHDSDKRPAILTGAALSSRFAKAVDSLKD